MVTWLFHWINISYVYFFCILLQSKSGLQILCFLLYHLCLYLFVYGYMQYSFYYFLIPIIVAAVIQIVKLIIDFIRSQRINFRNLLTAWWFPSVHSGLTSSVATLVFLLEWPHSLLFAVTLCFMLLISYDAMNVRYEAWRHAYYLNHIRLELKDVLRQKEGLDMRLKERIGHTRWEVLGGIVFGIVLTVLLYKMVYEWGFL